MGNRFANMPGYRNLIVAHGIIAAIVFLAVIPTAILVKQFYRDRLRGTRVHISLQVLALLLTTVLFILGFMAVGPARATSNPHHVMGVTIYVIMWIQFIGGWLVHSRERKKKQLQIPFRAFVSIQSVPGVGLLTPIATSTTGSNTRTARVHTGRPWTHPLRSTSVLIHSILLGRSFLGLDGIRPSLQEGTSLRTRLWQRLQLGFRVGRWRRTRAWSFRPFCAQRSRWCWNWCSGKSPERTT